MYITGVAKLRFTFVIFLQKNFFNMNLYIEYKLYNKGPHINEEHFHKNIIKILNIKII